MFPKLCGLKTLEVADMRELVMGISEKLWEDLTEGDYTIEEREELLNVAYEEAVEILNANGFEI